MRSGGREPSGDLSGRALPERSHPAWRGLRKSFMAALVVAVSLAACAPAGTPRVNAWDLDPGYDDRRAVRYPVASGAGYARQPYRTAPGYYPPRQAYYPRPPIYSDGRPDYYDGRRPDRSHDRYDRDRDRGREEARDRNRDRERDRAQQRERERERDRQRERERDRDRARPPRPQNPFDRAPQQRRLQGPLDCIQGQGGQRGCD